MGCQICFKDHPKRLYFAQSLCVGILKFEEPVCRLCGYQKTKRGHEWSVVYVRNDDGLIETLSHVQSRRHIILTWLCYAHKSLFFLTVQLLHHGCHRFILLLHLNKFNRCMCGPIIILCMYVKCQYIFYMEKQLQTNRFKAPVLQAYPSKVGQVTHVPKQQWLSSSSHAAASWKSGAHFLQSYHRRWCDKLWASLPHFSKTTASFWHFRF